MKPFYKLLIATFLLLIPSALFAQTKTVIAEGTWEIKNISIEEAKERALKQAQKNALEEAGAQTEIQVTDVMNVSDVNTWYSNFSKSEITGTIIEYDIIESILVSNGDIHLWKVKIKAKVELNKKKKGTTLDAHVSGFTTNYNEGDKLQFSIKTSEDCYVQIFWFDAFSNGSQFYPNDYEPAEPLKAMVEKKFPQSIEYTLYKETDELQESNSLVFIFTKKKQPFLKAGKDGNVKLKDMLEWFMKLPNDQRFMLTESIFIGKRGR